MDTLFTYLLIILIGAAAGLVFFALVALLLFGAEHLYRAVRGATHGLGHRDKTGPEAELSKRATETAAAQREAQLAAVDVLQTVQLDEHPQRIEYPTDAEDAQDTTDVPTDSAAVAHMADEVDEFYQAEPVPLPVGVRPVKSTIKNGDDGTERSVDYLIETRESEGITLPQRQVNRNLQFEEELTDEEARQLEISLAQLKRGEERAPVSPDESAQAATTAGMAEDTVIPAAEPVTDPVEFTTEPVAVELAPVVAPVELDAVEEPAVIAPTVPEAKPAVVAVAIPRKRGPLFPKPKRLPQEVKPEPQSESTPPVGANLPDPLAELRQRLNALDEDA